MWTAICDCFDEVWFMADTVHISSDASFEVVRRQVGQNRSERLILVLPVGWTEIDNLARMRLLQRQAQIQGSEIALVTHHEATRHAAKQTWSTQIVLK